MAARTLYEKIWDAHVVHEEPGQPSLIYIDRHLIHEGTSPQAFSGLKAAGRKVRRPELTFAVMDHSVSTKNRALPMLDPDADRAIRGARAQLPGVRHQPFRHAQPQSGHRARDRPGAWHHAARLHDRLRRQPHLHARRVRRAGFRHRHQRSGARARHAVPVAVQIEDHEDRRARASARAASPRRTSSSPSSAKSASPAATGHVVEYTGEAVRGLSMEGRMTDVQHVHRRRRARRHGGAGRYDVRLSRRPAVRSARQGFSGRGRRTGNRSPPIPARNTTRRLR